MGVWVGGGVRNKAVMLVGLEWEMMSMKKRGYKKQRWDDNLSWR